MHNKVSSTGVMTPICVSKLGCNKIILIMVDMSILFPKSLHVDPTSLLALWVGLGCPLQTRSEQLGELRKTEYANKCFWIGRCWIDVWSRIGATPPMVVDRSRKKVYRKKFTCFLGSLVCIWRCIHPTNFWAKMGWNCRRIHLDISFHIFHYMGN